MFYLLIFSLSNKMSLISENILDVTTLGPRLKHPTIFSHFDELTEGESFIIANDHDPQPLYYQLIELRGDIFTWEYLERGPEWWKIRIRKKYRNAPQAPLPQSTGEDNILNVTLLEPRLKHSTIFERFNALKPGESLYIHNDHDPKPLYYQLASQQGNTFEWEYQEQGPEWWKIRIKKHEEPQSSAIESEEDNILNVTLLEPRMKHPTIFMRFDELKEGEHLIIHNDHDPKPLYYQLLAERGNIFFWEYLQSGPVWWKIMIKKRIVNEGEETIGQIVAQDFRKAQVFKKYNINFSTEGRKTLKDVCYEKELDEENVKNEIRKIDRDNTERATPYNEWQPGFLMEYIVNTHHTYINRNLPELRNITAKVQNAHAKDHPELNKVNQYVNYISSELLAHLQKEERIVFPFFRNLIEAFNNNQPLTEDPFGSANVPINLMEMEHESIFSNLAEIRKLTNNYTLPVDACDSYNILFKMIQEFENDLQLHVHLENNILFPKMIEIAKVVSV